MKKSLLFSLIMSVPVAAGALYFSVRHVPLSELLQYLKNINYLWIFPAVMIVLLTQIVRAQRWQIIFAAPHKLNFCNYFTR
jgi:uncharacterized membrane protein YbhN (UPF0104 family)